MEQRDPPLSTPVLIGRDDLLALGRRRIEDVRAGRGHMLFLAGEAGIGKSRLLGSIARDATRRGMRVLNAGSTPRDLEVPGAILMDLGHRLATSTAPVEVNVGEAMLARLGGAPRSRGDPHRRRRVMVLDVVDLLARLAGHGPTMLALEDLHWADDLALEALAQLARRLEPLSLLVVGTYRSDELYPQVPMREWRARLVTQRLAEEARLVRLSREQTRAMVDHLLPGSLPAPTMLAEAVYERSDGIPLHVEELVAALRLGRDGDSRIPDTLAEAVLLRHASLSPAAADVAEVVAVIGRSFDLDLAAAAADRPVERVGRALAELRVRSFIVVADRPDWFEVRHALIRDALEAAMAPSRRRAAHERVARHAADRPELADDGFLSGHYEAAGLRSDAFRHARAAAARGAALSSHREALDLYRRALRCAPTDLPMAERAELLAALAAAEAATDDNAAAAASYAEARALLVADGRPVAAAALAPQHAAARHLLGDSLEARVELLQAGITELEEDAAASAADAAMVRGRLEAGLAAAYMLDRRLDEALQHGERAVALAADAADAATEINALVTLGATFVFVGRMEEGWSALEQSIARARSGRLEAEAARAYRMIGSSASVLVEYPRADRWLREGIAYAERTEQWNHRHYMAAHLGHVLWASGAWEKSEAVTRRALADGRGGITTRITALHVLGYLALGRGRWEEAAAALSEARELGSGMRELQRISPAVWGLAEMAELRGDHGEAVRLTDEGRRASLEVRDAAYLFPFLVTGVRARLALGDLGGSEALLAEVAAALRARSIPGTLPAIDHAEGLVLLARGRTGRARTALSVARAGWLERRRDWEWASATIDLAVCAQRANRRGEAAALGGEVSVWAERVGSEPIAARARELEAALHRHDLREAPWAPLTAREFEVARLIAAGRTNREIAEALTIAPKTVSAHVEHILARLGADRRTEIAAWVASVRAE